MKRTRFVHSFIHSFNPIHYETCLFFPQTYFFHLIFPGLQMGSTDDQNMVSGSCGGSLRTNTLSRMIFYSFILGKERKSDCFLNHHFLGNCYIYKWLNVLLFNKKSVLLACNKVNLGREASLQNERIPCLLEHWMRSRTILNFDGLYRNESANGRFWRLWWCLIIIWWWWWW